MTGCWVCQGDVTKLAPHIVDALASAGLLVATEPAPESFGVRLAHEGIARSRAESATDGVEDERLAVYEREREDLAAAIVKAVQGQYIGKPPPLLTGWQERAVSAVVTAGWLPPAAVQERVDAAVRAAIATMPKPAVTREQVEQAALFLFAVRTYSHRRADYARKCWDLTIDEDDREAWRRTARDLLAFADITVEDGEQQS